MMLILLAILTMVNMNWLGNLGNFQLRCCLAHAFCVDDQLASHHFFVVPNCQEVEAILLGRSPSAKKHVRMVLAMKVSWRRLATSSRR